MKRPIVLKNILFFSCALITTYACAQQNSDPVFTKVLNAVLSNGQLAAAIDGRLEAFFQTTDALVKEAIRMKTYTSTLQAINDHLNTNADHRLYFDDASLNTIIESTGKTAALSKLAEIAERRRFIQIGMRKVAEKAHKRYQSTDPLEIAERQRFIEIENRRIIEEADEQFPDCAI